MAFFRVWAASTSYCYLDVEAADEDEAISLAEEADGGEFIPDDGYGAGGFEVLDESIECLEYDDEDEDDDDDLDEDDDEEDEEYDF